MKCILVLSSLDYYKRIQTRTAYNIFPCNKCLVSVRCCWSHLYSLALVKSMFISHGLQSLGSPLTDVINHRKVNTALPKLPQLKKESSIFKGYEALQKTFLLFKTILMKFAHLVCFYRLISEMHFCPMMNNSYDIWERMFFV